MGRLGSRRVTRASWKAAALSGGRKMVQQEVRLAEEEARQGFAEDRSPLSAHLWRMLWNAPKHSAKEASA